MNFSANLLKSDEHRVNMNLYSMLMEHFLVLCVGLRQVQPDVCSRTAQEEKWVISQKLLSGLSGSYRLATNINQDMCLCFSYKPRISPKTS